MGTRSGGRGKRKETREAILDALKHGGPQDPARLSTTVGVSTVAVRQHLKALQEERLVTSREEARPIGRPARVWRLTERADAEFPDGHADLTRSWIDAMREALGPGGIDAVLEESNRTKAGSYRESLACAPDLRARAEGLAELRRGEGYMAELEELEDGSLLLVENHCPIRAAAERCPDLCDAEIRLFREVLGEDANVERTEHVLSGASRCAFRVSRSRRDRKPR